jgi:hypothetical protein
MQASHLRSLGVCGLVLSALAGCAWAQELTADRPVPAAEKVVPAVPIVPGTPKPEVAPGSEPIDKRILGVLPNYRTANMAAAAVPMTAKGKMTIAAKDSFDWPSYILAAGTSSIGQLSNANPSFGQGLKGYAHRYATGVGDQIIGNMLTEGIMPSLLHEDPRYFRMATGTKWARFRYAATRTLITRTDAGHARLNFSELGGNAIGAGIGNAYYPDGRHLGDNFQRFATQVGTDTFSNILKEFWPDIKRKFKHQSPAI